MDDRLPAIGENRITAGLHRVCLDVAHDLCVRGVTISVMTREGDEASAASSDASVDDVAKLQFDLGEGPSKEAFGTGRPVLVGDLSRSGGRWVGFTPAALALGVTGTYAFPLGVGAACLGVLTCYCGSDQVLGGADLSRCLEAAEVATDLLLSTTDGEEQPTSDPGVQRSLRIRTEVYQAQGMLMVALQVSLADALARLRAMAYAEGVDLNELAADLVAGRRPFPDR